LELFLPLHMSFREFEVNRIW